MHIYETGYSIDWYYIDYCTHSICVQQDGRAGTCVGLDCCQQRYWEYRESAIPCPLFSAAIPERKQGPSYRTVRTPSDNMNWMKLFTFLDNTQQYVCFPVSVHCLLSCTSGGLRGRNRIMKTLPTYCCTVAVSVDHDWALSTMSRKCDADDIGYSTCNIVYLIYKMTYSFNKGI